MNLISGCKKGNAIVESTFFLIMLVLFAIISIFAYDLMQEIDVEIQNSTFISAEGKDISSDLETRLPGLTDGMFVTMFTLLWILIIVASFRIDSHPVFFIFTFVLLLAVLFVATAVSNIYGDVVNDNQLGTLIDNFPMTDFIIDHLLTVILAIAASIAIVLYAKNKNIGT